VRVFVFVSQCLTSQRGHAPSPPFTYIRINIYEHRNIYIYVYICLCVAVPGLSMESLLFMYIRINTLYTYRYVYIDVLRCLTYQWGHAPSSRLIPPPSTCGGHDSHLNSFNCCSVLQCVEVFCNVWQIRVHSVSTSWFHVSFSTVAYNCESHYTTQVFHNCDVLQCFANVNRHTRLASIQSHLYIYECISTCICTHIYVYIYICTYICVHVFIYMHSTSSDHQSYTSWHTYQWLVATIFTFHITSC